MNKTLRLTLKVVHSSLSNSIHSSLSMYFFYSSLMTQLNFPLLNIVACPHFKALPCIVHNTKQQVEGVHTYILHLSIFTFHSGDRVHSIKSNYGTV